MTDTVRVPREALYDLLDAASSFCEDGDLLAGEIRIRVKAMLAASPQGEESPPAMSADHIGGASPAVTEVGKLIQAPLVGRLVEALKAARAFIDDWAVDDCIAANTALARVEAVIDEAFAHHNATNTVAPMEAVACQKCGGEVQGWTCQGCGQGFRENDGGALIFDTHPAPIKPSGDTGELRERMARIIDPISWEIIDDLG